MKRLLSAIETMAALSLLLIAVLTAGNVLLRYAFSIQIPDWFDGSRMLQGIALFWGIALATYYGTHLGVDLLWESLQAKGQRLPDSHGLDGLGQGGWHRQPGHHGPAAAAAVVLCGWSRGRQRGGGARAGAAAPSVAGPSGQRG
jgi:hypothetical protein